MASLNHLTQVLGEMEQIAGEGNRGPMAPDQQDPLQAYDNRADVRYALEGLFSGAKDAYANAWWKNSERKQQAQQLFSTLQEEIQLFNCPGTTGTTTGTCHMYSPADSVAVGVVGSYRVADQGICKCVARSASMS
jgi:hypothetical protein